MKDVITWEYIYIWLVHEYIYSLFLGQKSLMKLFQLTVRAVASKVFLVYPLQFPLSELNFACYVD